MPEEIPRSKWERGLTGTKTAVKMGQKALKYLAVKPFLAEEKRLDARTALNRETAALLFQGMYLLRGTALKMAQFLSMELDIFPPEMTKELQKSYHQVPPINRAVVRKVIQNGLGKPPEQIFQDFDTLAFAAASLGQVHRATARDGNRLAVKIQYPGIRETIHNDVQLMRCALRRMTDYQKIAPVIEEIKIRLLEETDYRMEAQNMTFFKERLNLDQVMVPAFYGDFSADTVISTEYMNGMTLNEWLSTEPDQKKKDRVAQALNDLFVFGLYQLKCIHADPNPGNFIVNGDSRIGLVDFGCVKHFDPEFVALHGKLSQAALHGGPDDYMRLSRALHTGGADASPEIEERAFKAFYQTSQWLGKLYRDECFDFNANPEFIAAGKKMMVNAVELRHMDINTNFIFLHRTRYGLLRLFDQMKARVCFRNPYEY
jgi:predicted unusual protein kinase regulating ubiquinone biosynthesis (AarF/ABC1/UbiB family)